MRMYVCGYLQCVVLLGDAERWQGCKSVCAHSHARLEFEALWAHYERTLHIISTFITATKHPFVLRFRPRPSDTLDSLNYDQ